jgi:hypothetical protein
MRASESVTPPGGNGTITFTGFCGHGWAIAFENEKTMPIRRSAAWFIGSV